MPKLTYAFCTFNRADRLERLVATMRAQTCPIAIEILAINNNSTDNTLQLLKHLAKEPGPPLRFVTETEQGIVPARNRAIEEAIDSDIMVFIDDDELPMPGLLHSAWDAIINEGAECVGGAITVDLERHGRPKWLDAEVAGFLGALNHGDQSLWVSDGSLPIWSGNVAYDMQLFRNDAELRFDTRYNREGVGVGGGEDGIMLRSLLARGTRIRYRPDMVVAHDVEPWKLKRVYFLKLHYRSGQRQGQFQLPDYPRTVMGVPRFLIAQGLQQTIKAIGMGIARHPKALRQAMNGAHTWGMIRGSYQRWLEKKLKQMGDV